MGEMWLALPSVTDTRNSGTRSSTLGSSGQADDAMRLRGAATRWLLSPRHIPQVLDVDGCELITMQKPEPDSRLHGEVQALLKSGLIGREQGERYLKALDTLSPPAKLPRSVCLHADGRPAASVLVDDAVADSTARWISARQQCTVVTDYDYWDTVGGTPAAFVRPWELARQMASMSAPVDSVIEFGYGIRCTQFPSGGEGLSRLSVEVNAVKRVSSESAC